MNSWQVSIEQIRVIGYYIFYKSIVDPIIKKKSRIMISLNKKSRSRKLLSIDDAVSLSYIKSLLRYIFLSIYPRLTNSPNAIILYTTKLLFGKK